MFESFFESGYLFFVSLKKKIEPEMNYILLLLDLDSYLTITINVSIVCYSTPFSIRNAIAHWFLVCYCAWIVNWNLEKFSHETTNCLLFFYKWKFSARLFVWIQLDCDNNLILWWFSSIGLIKSAFKPITYILYTRIKSVWTTSKSL